ncbi:MAG TPA: tetratricopeptide repeat protein, partial [Candidatus Angelobacter sp.]
MGSGSSAKFHFEFMERSHQMRNAYYIAGLILLFSCGFARPQTNTAGQNSAQAQTEAAAHFHLAKDLEARGDLNGAIAEYREAVKLKPDDMVLHGSLGAALSKKGEVDASIAELREAVRLAPDQAATHVNLAIAFELKDDFDEAIVELQQGIRLDPKHGNAHYHLAHD